MTDHDHIWQDIIQAPVVLVEGGTGKGASPVRTKERQKTQPVPPLVKDGKAVEVRTTNGLNAKPTPVSLYLTTAILCSHSLISLPSLVPHLQNIHDTITVTDDLLESCAIWRKQFGAIIRRMGVVSLNSNANKEKDKNKDGGTATNNVVHSSSEVMRRLETACETNQLVQLLHMLLQVGLDWEDVTDLFCAVDDGEEAEEEVVARHRERSLGERAVTACCSIYPPLQGSLCRYFFSLVEGVYQERVRDIGAQLCHPPVGRNGGGGVSVKDFGAFSLLPDRLIDGPSSSCGIGRVTSAVAAKMTLLQLSQVLAGPLVAMVETGCIATEPVIYCKLCRLVRVLLLDHMDANGKKNGTRSCWRRIWRRIWRRSGSTVKVWRRGLMG